jgi:hypothetical protein
MTPVPRRKIKKGEGNVRNKPLTRNLDSYPNPQKAPQKAPQKSLLPGNAEPEKEAATSRISTLQSTEKIGAEEKGPVEVRLQPEPSR